MVCIYCGNKTAVSNSRAKKRTNEVWRRRVCQDCNATFTSVETIDLGTALLVNNKRGHFEPFYRDKLFASVYDSLKHRNNALAAATGLTATIVGKVLAHAKSAQVQREYIIKTTAEVLKRYDKAASVHYAAYHPI